MKKLNIAYWWVYLILEVFIKCLLISERQRCEISTSTQHISYHRCQVNQIRIHLCELINESMWQDCPGPSPQKIDLHSRYRSLNISSFLKRCRRYLKHFSTCFYPPLSLRWSITISTFTSLPRFYYFFSKTILLIIDRPDEFCSRI